MSQTTTPPPRPRQNPQQALPVKEQFLVFCSENKTDFWLTHFSISPLAPLCFLCPICTHLTKFRLSHQSMVSGDNRSELGCIWWQSGFYSTWCIVKKIGIRQRCHPTWKWSGVHALWPGVNNVRFLRCGVLKLVSRIDRRRHQPARRKREKKDRKITVVIQSLILSGVKWHNSRR